MGQAFRRASGRIRATDSSPATKTVVDRRPPEITPDKVEILRTSAQCNNQDNLASGEDGIPKVNTENELEEKDPQYDAMLNQMVGRIRTKPGGKLEMGEAAVGERYDRPMPKLRNTKPDSTRYEERPAPPGTLNIAQLRHMMLLHQGKADDQTGPMDIHQIANKFRLEVDQVQQILKFVTLPPEEKKEERSNQ
ncbi:uncharacterized protein LOC126669363 [Mercurialis annua]|uniref:uncharacterized protein LOC126669363 n=1 Tax=Mercurialis annua TaxID=3986 RepID=UPI002160C638|nr:uncharacterized protein LOC126669363 [Mercurialis annua]